MNNEGSNYYLVLEYRPGDFMPIDINILKNNRFIINYSYLQSIDNFTKNYTEFDLREMIRLNNLVPNIYLSGKLHIMNQNNYRFPVFTKDDVYSLPQFLLDHIDDKQVMNKFMNIYLKYDKDNLINMKHAIINKDVNEILMLLGNLPYEQIRAIYMYINKNILVFEKRRILENDKAA